MSTRDFLPRPQGAEADSVPFQNWLDALGNRQNIDLQQELTSVASGDELLVFDVSETGNVKTKKATVSNVGSTIAGGGFAGSFTTVTATGLVDISASGAGQIKFPATQNASSNANTLDDYEEGTWTPADGSGAGLTFTFNSGGQYEKIGRQVRASCGIAYPTTADGSTAYVSGLPFTVGSHNSNRQGLCSITNKSSINGVACVPSDTKVDFRKNDINQMTNAEMTDALFYFTVLYAV